jgi:hypothetical protein
MKKFYLSASEASFAEEVPVEFKFLDGSLILVAGLLLGFPAHAGEGPIEASWAGAEGTDQLLMGREGLRWRVLCQRPIVSSDSSRSAKGKVKEVELEYARTKHAEALMGKNIEFNELDYQMCAMWHAPNTTSVERAELSAMRLDLLSARVRMMSGR